VDDRTWKLAVGTLAAAVGAVLLDAALPGFEIPPGFFPVLAATMAFLGGRSIFKGKGDE
jgi:hypothetical protein